MRACGTVPWLTPAAPAGQRAGRRRVRFEQRETGILTRVIARGRRSEILEWGDGKVLKLYFPGWSQATFDGEVAATRWLHEHGLPVPAVYGTLVVDGRLGIVMERIDGPAMPDVATAHPERIPELAETMARLQAGLHDFQAPDEAAGQTELLARKILSTRSPLETDKKEALAAAVRGMPQGISLCHGDFHPQNILLPPGRPPVVIDWDCPTKGNALADLARTVLLLRGSVCYAGSGRPELAGVLTGMLERVGDHYLECYFRVRPCPAEDLEKWVWINAAARLCEGIVEEDAWLLGLVERGFDRFAPAGPVPATP